MERVRITVVDHRNMPGTRLLSQPFPQVPLQVGRDSTRSNESSFAVHIPGNRDADRRRSLIPVRTENLSTEFLSRPRADTNDVRQHASRHPANADSRPADIDDAPVRGCRPDLKAVQLRNHASKVPRYPD
jgi:hypothetical protein